MADTYYEILPQFDVPLKPGGRSSVVYDLQGFLAGLGFYSEELDGTIGPAVLDGIDQAWKAYYGSPFLEVRDLVQGSWTGLSAGQVLKVLQQATRAGERQVGIFAGAPSSQPTSPDEEIFMSPQMVIAGQQRLEKDNTSATSALGWWVAGGLGLALVLSSRAARG